METNQDNTSELDFKDSKYATGKRKTSIAKIWLKKGSGKIVVNGKDYKVYFTRANHKMQLLRPFEIINQTSSYDVRCNVRGGGHTGQAREFALDGILAVGFSHVVGVGQPHADLRAGRTTEGSGITSEQI